MLFSLVADTTYKVEKGDTLYSISRKYQITVAELRAANNLSENDVIKVGQKLKIYSGSSTASTGTSTPSTSSGTTGSAGTTGSSGSTGNSGTTTTTTTAPDTRTYGTTVTADKNTVWPVKNPTVTQVKGKVGGVQLSAQVNEPVVCIREGTVMYVGVYRGFGQVVFVQSKTGVIYTYTGLGSVNVKKGDYVIYNQQLGTAGIDSITKKPCITFMVFQNGQPIDPAKAPRN